MEKLMHFTSHEESKEPGFSAPVVSEMALGLRESDPRYFSAGTYLSK